jgi:sphingolipid 4-desaturase/C4-monooxygenase
VRTITGEATAARAALDFAVGPPAEPHRARAARILAVHPEIRRCVARNPWSAAVAAGLAALQFGLATSLGHAPWVVVLLVAYGLGAFVSHALLVMVHESAHRLVFRSAAGNTIVGIIAGLPCLIINSVTWSRYHLKHHAHQGVYEIDFDIPSRWEARFIGTSTLAKGVWLLLFPLFHMARVLRNPAEIEELRPSAWVIVNAVLEVAVAAALLWFGGPRALAYLLASMFASIGLHPLGGRWFQEHYVTTDGQETYSYYGPLNRVAFNVGYHQEHHDFPGVPWHLLPRVTRWAAEYYTAVASHQSWTKLCLRFLFGPDLTLFRRVVRPRDGVRRPVRSSPSL